MAPDPADPRPLSPHLSVWRWHPTMATSILHRFSGIINYVAATAIGVWIVLLATGADGAIGFIFDSPWSLLLQIALIVATWAAGYHWLNGLRHLVWDAGHGFDPDQANLVSWLILAASVLPPVLIWAPVFTGGV